MSSPVQNAHRTVHHNHIGWSREFPPTAVIVPGETLNFSILDASGGQLSRQSTTADVPKLDFDTVNPLTGPVYI
ncbi:MAG TPA: acetamidase/formamidase family protein, partial [Deinococcales bacterium]|nr:acetamidase/formamidase family protein [Deinococcales bacterium]